MNQMFNAMNTVAAASSTLMEAGIAHGIGPGEESLTDVNLIQLCQLIPSLRVKKFGKTEEAGNGADWEWWIGSFEDRWIQLRIQAKRSSHDGRKYEHLGYTTEGRTEKQYDVLITKSLIEGAIPFHVFFNGWPEDRYLVKDLHHDVIARDRRAGRDVFLPSSVWDSRHWGCTIASTDTVKTIYEDPKKSGFPRSMLTGWQAKGKLYVPHYLTHSTPWSHLFYSSNTGRTPTVREVAQNLHRLQGKDGVLTDEEFLDMTHPQPSSSAEAAAYGQFTLRKAITSEQDRTRPSRDRERAQDFISSIESPSDLSHLLEDPDGEESEPAYRLLLDLDPENSPFFNENYQG
ncbi:DUF6615 family protein [Rhodococcus sp. C3V]|uniref:DUF6615 family protein n=1 Tax=Rhodococcus sp. C3V TaxID=3034165 RepID=UPI0023E14B42|nr:DUF6615 family protein [Rhodococcus sp. C3V]MDF3319792.1 hypothetical protein [Rhodococcus sp. C3V]